MTVTSRLIPVATTWLVWFSVTALHRGERLEFAPVERVEQPEFSKEEGTEGAPTSRDPGDDQLSEFLVFM